MKTRQTFTKSAILTTIAFLGISLGAYSQTQKGLDIDGVIAGEYSGSSVSMPTNTTVAIGAPDNQGNGSWAGQVRVYNWINKAWTQKGPEINGESDFDFSGHAVCMPDANTLAIGASQNDGNGQDAGHVRVFTWNSVDWIQKGSDIDGRSTNDYSGWAISMPDKNTIAIGGIGNNLNGTNSGHVRVFIWDGNDWTQKGGDIDGSAPYDNSGYSVSMPDVNTVAIGAPFHGGNGNPESGQVRVYTWNGTYWIQKGTDIYGEAEGDQSGTSVSMPDANTLAIGADHNSGLFFWSGHVRVYSWTGSNWIQKGNDIDGEAAFRRSGYSVSMPNANTVAIGAPGSLFFEENAGYVRVFSWKGNDWDQKGMNIAGESVLDFSGASVSMPDNNTVAIGAPRNNGNGEASGHVRVFTLPTVGIEENSFTDKFTIYPNPTTGQLSITFDAVQEDLHVSLYTLDGKLLENRTAKNTANLSFEITAPAGIYLLRMSNQNQQATVRVVKE